MRQPSQIDLKFLYGYNPAKGVLVHRMGRGGVRAGDSAGYLDATGYVQIRFNGRLTTAHRLIWIWHNGAIPEGLNVDHIDRDKANNRIENLRLLSDSGNTHNTVAKSGTGYKGVYKHGSGYRAKIQIDGKEKCLGTFPTPEEASQVYNKAAYENYGFHHNG